MQQLTPHQELLADLRSPQPARQNHAYEDLLAATRNPVDWAYEIWDDLVRTLADGDNRQRSIAAQILSGLAKSDPRQRMLKDLPALLKVTKDKRFVTARHCLQSLWQVGVAGDAQRQALLKGLEVRYQECASEKNGALTRYDILVVLRRVCDLVGDEQIRALSQRLIATEQDPKYRKKYATVWRNKPITATA